MHSGAIYSHIKSHFSKLKGYFKETFRRQHETLKLKITRDLLNAYPEKKFVIFCHYIAVAHCLCDYLSSRGIKCYYLEGDVGKNDNEFNNFNESKGKTNVLIVTDEHSQGISLHKSEAWLIHFELSWNPIRIIQRYGRVWRINNTTHKLTLPSAFYIPHSFSSEEEQIARLKRRWQVLKNLPNNEKSFVNLAPISFEIALGTRCSPLPYKS
jgi:superfamily II DNA/RNA helicase